MDQPGDRRAKTLIFHAGGPKTGSSAIQACLQQRAAEIGSQGIYVPRPVGLHHRLASIFIGDDSIRRRPDVASIEEMDREIVEKSIAEFRDSESNYILMSSEYFRLLDIESFQDYFSELGICARIMFFCREQSELIASGYNQDVKALGRYDDVPAINDATVSQYDWGAYYDRLVKTFGSGNVFFYDFAIARKHAGSIVGYFFEKLSAVCGRTVQVTRPEQFIGRNESLNAYALQIRRYMNRTGEARLEPFFEHVRRLSGAPAFGLSREQAEAAHALFGESNAAIASKVARDGAGELSLLPETEGVDARFTPDVALALFADYLEEIGKDETAESADVDGVAQQGGDPAKPQSHA